MIEQKAPGCYGAASVYSQDSNVCQGCVAYEQCGSASLATLEAIRATVDVRDLLRRHSVARAKAAPAPAVAPQPIAKSPIKVSQPKVVDKPIERTTTQERLNFDLTTEMSEAIERIAAQNKKAADQAKVLCKMGRITEMRAMLPKGLNPFTEGGPAFMRVTCAHLINGGFTRASLRAALMQELNWPETTAAPHVSIVVAILGAFRIVGKDGENIVLHPGLG